MSMIEMQCCSRPRYLATRRSWFHRKCMRLLMDVIARMHSSTNARQIEDELRRRLLLLWTFVLWNCHDRNWTSWATVKLELIDYVSCCSIGLLAFRQTGKQWRIDKRLVSRSIPILRWACGSRSPHHHKPTGSRDTLYDGRSLARWNAAGWLLGTASVALRPSPW